MSHALFDYPKQAYFGKTIPKSKFYEFGNVSTRLKDIFVREVEQITWEYKLSSETINLPSTANISEIQIFNIKLKGPFLNEEILRCIDNAVKFPVIFELEAMDKIQVVATLKNINPANGTLLNGGLYFYSDLIDKDSQKISLEYSLNLEMLYEQIFKALIPIKPGYGESINDLVKRVSLIKRNKEDFEKLKKKIKLEKQFNKKIELNKKIKQIQLEIEALEGSKH